MLSCNNSNLNFSNSKLNINLCIKLEPLIYITWGFVLTIINGSIFLLYLKESYLLVSIFSTLVFALSNLPDIYKLEDRYKSLILCFILGTIGFCGTILVSINTFLTIIWVFLITFFFYFFTFKKAYYRLHVLIILMFAVLQIHMTIVHGSFHEAFSYFCALILGVGIATIATILYPKRLDFKTYFSMHKLLLVLEEIYKLEDEKIINLKWQEFKVLFLKFHNYAEATDKNEDWFLIIEEIKNLESVIKALKDKSIMNNKCNEIYQKDLDVFFQKLRLDLKNTVLKVQNLASDKWRKYEYNSKN